ncbi:MAG: hypothetical protein Q7V57_07620 [Actinomycetota bacterium]|nr:hypothetical protein [Actinomycetota bacterium]
MSFVEVGVAGFVADGSIDDVSTEISVVALASLPVGSGWRADGLNDAHVAALAARYAHLPPVLVRRTDLLVVDGAHTVAAARRLGMQVAHVQWFDGTWVEAAAAFATRNSVAPALALTADDRRNLIHSTLRAEPTWSDRRIAQVCGVSPKMIARVRSGAPSPQQVSGAEKRVGRDGRARPVRAGAMRSSILQMLEQQPDASLRTIASALGVSPETVRSVRKDREVGSGPVVRIASTHHSRALEELTQRPRREPPAPWRGDAAFGSTSVGEEFVAWFEATNVLDDRGRVDEVPLSRIYEIADEARRRAAYWSAFADSVEGRARRR